MNRLLFNRNPLNRAVSSCVYAVGLIGSLATNTALAGNEIVRAATATPFGVPEELLRFGPPAVTTIDGAKYLHWIATTDEPDLAESLIVGPLDSLLDRTVPWEDLIYSSERFSLPEQCAVSSEWRTCLALVDLDDDGLVELNIDNRLYVLDSQLSLLTDSMFETETDSDYFGIWPDYRSFADADDDGDLDLFLMDSKTSSHVRFFENVGDPQAAVFVQAPTESEAAFARTKPLSLGASSLYGLDFVDWTARYTSLEVDLDGDGDTDIVEVEGNKEYISRYLEGNITNAIARFTPVHPHVDSSRYLENVGTDDAPVFTNPFFPFPVPGAYIQWITDFDSDGDLDVLAYDVNRPGELAFFEKRDGIPFLYAAPAFLGNLPRLSSSKADYAAGVDRYLRRTQSPFVTDLDGDGYPEFLLEAWYEGTPLVRDMELITLRNGQFERIDIPLESDTVSRADYARAGGAFFHDIDQDGDLDVVYRAEGAPVSFIFEQTTPLVFAPPRKTLEDLSYGYPELVPVHTIDLDDDGDLDTFNDVTGQVDINLERSPGSIRSFSTRSYVGESGADVQVGGFIIEGHSAQTVILRGLGPSLAAEGIRRPLQDPQLQLYSGKTVIASNDDWGAHPQADRIASAGIAPTDPKEAALRVRLNPGVYTVILKGRPGDTGVGIVAIDNDIQMPSMATQTSLSGRALIGPGENVAVGGFIIDGDTPVKVLLRGLGPSLAEAGIDRPLSDPTLTLYAGQQPILANDDWQEAANAAEIAALAHAPQYAKEAAILTELPPGTYTVHLRNADGTNGVGIVAVDRP